MMSAASSPPSDATAVSRSPAAAGTLSTKARMLMPSSRNALISLVKAP